MTSLPDASREAPWRARLIARLEARDAYSKWVLFAALSGMFAATFPITILTVSLPSIAHEFGTRETTMAWVIAAPMLVSAPALPLLGKLGDLRGHRRVFLFGTAAAAATAIATSFAWNPAALISLRTLASTLGERIGERAAAWIGCLVMALSMIVLATGALASSFWAVGIGLVLQGVGYGLGTPSIASAATNAAAEEDLGIASAVSRLMGSVGSSFGVTLLTLIYGGTNTPRSFAFAFGAGGVLAVGAVAASLAMQRRRSSYSERNSA